MPERVSNPTFSQAGQLVSIEYIRQTLPGFSSEEIQRVVRACGQLGVNLGATQAFAGFTTGRVDCDLFDPV